jgi:hypothetical protein
MIDPFTMAAIAQVGMGLMGAMGEADAAAAEVANKRMQIEWGNHQGMMKLQRDNRNIARQNAAQWLMNQEITALAYDQAAEQQVYLRHKIDNELGMFSTQMKSQTDAVISNITSRGIGNDSGSSQAMMRSIRAKQNAILEDQNVSYSNDERDINRRKDGMLAKRNFGYNDFMKFVSTPSDHLDPQAAYDNTLTAGLINVGISAAVTMQSDALADVASAQHTEQMDILRGLTGGLQTKMDTAQLFNTTGMGAQAGIEKINKSLALWGIFV